MIHVGFIDPGSKKLSDSMPHIGLAYIAASLEQKGHSVSILDTGISERNEVETFVRTPFDIIGVTATSFTFRDAVEVIKVVKDTNPQVPIVLGGPHASVAREELFGCEEIDFAVYGEGEEAMPELVRCLEGGSDFSQGSYEAIAGLMYRKNGKIVVNALRPWNRALDSLPFPSYGSLPMERYELYPLITSRGCPYECTYCAASTVWGRRWRARSPENLLEEIQYLLSNWGRKEIAVCDDNFNVQVNRAMRFCELLIDSGMNVEWSCWSFRADCADPDLLKAMKESGCKSVSVGIESANPQVLKNIKKRETVEEIEEGIRNIKEAGLQCIGLNMIGNQGDNSNTIGETIAFNRKLKIDDAKFFLAIPYPKTELWDYVEKNGRFLKTDYTQFHHFSDEPIFETDDFTAEERAEAYRTARKFTLKNRLRADIWNKSKRILRGDLKGIGLTKIKRSLRRIARTAFDVVLRREQEV